MNKKKPSSVSRKQKRILGPKETKRRDLIAAVRNMLDYDFHYAGVEIEYETDHDECDEDDYHRNCRIRDVQVVNVDTKYIIDKIAACFEDIHERCQATRILTESSALSNRDNYETEIGGDYYGDEIHGVKLNKDIQQDLLDKICATIKAMQP